MTIVEFLLARIAEDERDGCPCRFVDEDRDICDDRWRAECGAKRQIIALHEQGDGVSYRGTEFCSRCTASGEYPADDAYTDEQNWPCPTLRALAAVYADHPDYRQEWRP
ncbi:DUF6221 family protein [Nocardioides sp. T2.26MG-1]|uniref:DUF6221 family protein n=1 Tax=Nocardioides sp. T2.26MG-1 TaxID=3041166 RepID=UPI0024774F03|nr:DUF6221 family protein [Nocardioides sp. T2.26MG-1]CAI9417307.1 hypothetical protein HIDPHFAB_02987 [Nocardioides sp. T2.26MG-1]